jgi:hypothetical protein
MTIAPIIVMTIAETIGVAINAAIIASSIGMKTLAPGMAGGKY